MSFQLELIQANNILLINRSLKQYFQNHFILKDLQNIFIRALVINHLYPS